MLCWPSLIRNGWDQVKIPWLERFWRIVFLWDSLLWFLQTLSFFILCPEYGESMENNFHGEIWNKNEEILLFFSLEITSSIFSSHFSGPTPKLSGCWSSTSTCPPSTESRRTVLPLSASSRASWGRPWRTAPPLPRLWQRRWTSCWSWTSPQSCCVSNI